jgi:branched-chain amino acid transport system permease protein
MAGAMAALAGVMLSAGPRGVSLELSAIALRAFPAMILGGMDSPAGAVAGGGVIGATEVLTAAIETEYSPWVGSNFHVVMPYLVMIVILVLRPYGLFGARRVERV